MAKQRIPYADIEAIDDPDMLAEFERARTMGTPRPESQAVRAHVPATFWSFTNTWKTVFHSGVAEHAIKELCRVYVSKSVKCEYCGNQRSVQSARQGLVEDDYLDLLNFETSERYDDRQKAALRYTEAIVWDLTPDDRLWEELYEYFTVPEVVEIGYFVAITMGQQRWLRILNIDHHQVLAGTDASMIPGGKTPDEYESLKESDDYWAKSTGAQA
jgi:alkylhydroperoxidase family enzyme